jgi:hypothetical protein
MTGELILTSNTYDEGRIAINDSFSGTAVFNILSANTFYNPSSIFSSSTGANSYIANNGTGNLAAGEYSIAIGSGSTALSGFSIANGVGNVSSGEYSFAGGAYCSTSGFVSHAEGVVCSAGTLSFVYGWNSFGSEGTTIFGVSNFGIGNYSTLFGIGNYTYGYAAFAVGEGNSASGRSSVTLGNNNTTSKESSFAGGADSSSLGVNSFVFSSGSTTNADYSSIIGGYNNVLNATASGSSIIGMAGFTGTNSSTVYVKKAYIDDFLDLNPQTTLPPASIGRIFFSGTPLNRMMQNTGGTSADWCII